MVLTPDEDGCIVAECPALPGCFSQGKTEQEVLANIAEAITASLWVEDQKLQWSFRAIRRRLGHSL